MLHRIEGPAAILWWPFLGLSLLLTLQFIVGGPFRQAVTLDPAASLPGTGFAAGSSLPRHLAPQPRHLALVTVTEDGRQLPFRVKSQTLIEKRGFGRYRFRGRTVSFSSSDGSRPADNGRVYQAIVPRPVPVAWLIASWAAAAVFGYARHRGHRGLLLPVPLRREEGGNLIAPGLPEGPDRLVFRVTAAGLSACLLWTLLLSFPASTLPLSPSLTFFHEWSWKVTVFGGGLLLTALALAAPPTGRIPSGSGLSDAGFLLLASLFLFGIRLPACLLLEGNPDESDWIAGAAVLAEDPRFWISYDGVTSGPLVVFPLLLITLVGAPVNYLTVKLFVVLLWVAIAILFFRGAARLYSSRTARIATLPLVFAAATASYPDFVAYNGEHIPILLLSVAWFAFATLSTGRGGAWPYLLFGAALGAVPYAKLQAAPMALLIAVAGGLQMLLRRERRLPAFVAGGLIPSGLLLVYLVSAGATDEFLRSYLGYNLEYAGRSPRRLGLTGILGFVWTFSSHFQPYFLVWLAASLAGVAGWFRSRGPASPAPTGLPAFALALAAAALYCVLQPLRPFAHYLLLLVLPGALIGATVLGHFLATRPSGRSWAAAGTIAALPWLHNLYADHHHLLALPPAIPRPLGIGSSPVAEEILRHARPGDRLAIWGWASRYYVQTGLLPATRVPINSRQTNEGRYQAFFREEFIRDLELHQPRIFLEIDRDHPLADYLEIAAYLSTHYRPVGEVEGATIHLRNAP